MKYIRLIFIGIIVSIFIHPAETRIYDDGVKLTDVKKISESTFEFNGENYTIVKSEEGYMQPDLIEGWVGQMVLAENLNNDIYGHIDKATIEISAFKEKWIFETGYPSTGIPTSGIPFPIMYITLEKAGDTVKFYMDINTTENKVVRQMYLNILENYLKKKK